jgi:hypothetical protein
MVRQAHHERIKKDFAQALLDGKAEPSQNNRLNQDLRDSGIFRMFSILVIL